LVTLRREYTGIQPFLSAISVTAGIPDFVLL